MQNLPTVDRNRLSISTFIKTPHGEIVFLAILFFLALLIRRIGLKFGSPFLTHPDEWTIVEPAFTMTRDRTFDSGAYMRPNQITQLLNFFYLNIISLIKSGQDLSVTLRSNEFFYYYSARFLTAIFGSLIPIVAYKIGKQSAIDYSMPAAILFAFFPVYVLYSHFATPDIPITFFTLMIILFSLKYVRGGKPKFLYLATLFAAINTAEKYPGLLSFSIIAFSILWVQNEKYQGQPLRILKHTFTESLKFFGVFVFFLYIIAPNIFINYGEVIENISTEARARHPGSDGLGWLANMGFYIQRFVKYANLVVILLLLVGIAGTFITKNYYVLFGLYGLVYWVILSRLALHWERWALPMYTFPLLFAAFGFAFLWRVSKSNRLLNAVVGLVFGVSMVGLFMNSLSLSIQSTYTHTTVATYQFCRDSGINPENSIYDGYTPFSPNSNQFINLSLATDETEFIIISSGAYGRFYNEPDRYAKRILVYEKIRRENIFVQKFASTEPSSNIPLIAWANDIWYYTSLHLGATPSPRFSGPTIEIYQINR